MKKVSIIIAVVVFGWMNGLSQLVPTPGKAQSQPIVLKNAVIHLGTGDVIKSGAVLLVNGKIQQVGETVAAPAGAEVIDLAGKHLYPGIIAPSTQIGMNEIEAVRATNDIQETGLINPNMRAIISYNADSRVTPTLRSNGVLLAQIAPQGRLLAGTSSIVQLDAWNWEDAAYQLDDGVHLYWPRMRVSTSWWAGPPEEQKKRTQKYLDEIELAMQQTKAYQKAKMEKLQPQFDLRWEAMRPVLEGKSRLFVHAQTEKQIMAAVAMAQKHSLAIVIIGGKEAWRVTTLLKENNVPVILAQPHSLPTSADDPIDIQYRQPKILQDAGVQYCLSMNNFWDQRNLPFMAGTAAAYGLTQEQAIASITLNTAKILGIDNRTGSIETGKDANLIVSTGDLLDMRTSHIELAFIQGRKVDLGNHQKDLVKKFEAR